MSEVEKKEIEAMANAICLGCKTRHKCDKNGCAMAEIVAEALYNAGYGKVEDYKKEIFALKTTLEDREHEVRELNKKVERLEQSLSNCAFMTSSIGDLPINSVGLGRAVDEIARLQIVEAELQELTAKYYNEAKDSRRTIKKLKEENKALMQGQIDCANEGQQAIKEFAERLKNKLVTRDYIGQIHNGRYLSTVEIDDLLKEYDIRE